MKIICKDINKIYKVKKGLFKSEKYEVIKSLNYSLDQGDIVGIVGSSKAGKTTFINLLSGKEAPTCGNILIDGEENYQRLRENCEIINDLESRKLLKTASVYNNLVYFGHKYKLDSLDVEQSISNFKNIFELEKIINKKIFEITEFELIKVNLTISILKKTPILLFDSALSRLSVIEKNLLLKMLKRLNKEYKTTIVIATNDIGDIEKICKRIVIVKKGEIVIDDNFDKVKKELFNNKDIKIIFNKSFVVPKGDFKIIENSDYLLRIRIDFNKCEFAALINQLDINSIVDINISYIPLEEL